MGGYDTSRFVSNNVSFSFEADISRDLLVKIQSITSDTTSSPLLSSEVYAFIDSLVPHIWLPFHVCVAFEQAFGLVWNATSELYLVTDEMHTNLVEQNANVTFRLGPSSTGGSAVDIVMSYGNFDLTANPPFVNNSTRYFPLKRALNDSQYTLGRTFLQQAYLIVDYDRSNFSVSQALFPSTSVGQNLVPILAPYADPTSPQPNVISTGTIVYIVVAVVAFIILLICSITFFVVRQRRRRRAAAGPRDGMTELDTSGNPKADLDISEMAGSSGFELSASNPTIGRHEMLDEVNAIIQKMSAEDVPVPELQGLPVAIARS